jgi:hypothetical protein
MSSKKSKQKQSHKPQPKKEDTMDEPLIEVDQNYSGPGTHEAASTPVGNGVEAPAKEPKKRNYVERPAVAYAADSPEVLAKDHAIEAHKMTIDALTAEIKDLRALIVLTKKEKAALLAGPRRGMTHTFTFVAPGVPFSDLRLKNGKPLPYQANLLLEIFIGQGQEAGTEISYTTDEVKAKLDKDFSCIGDKMNNFSWHKSNIFKGLGLMK